MKTKTETVILNNAVEINGKKLKKISLREPKAGELRSLSMLEVVQLNTNALTILVPRISDLTETDINNMGAADLLLIGAAVASFFAPAA